MEARLRGISGMGMKELKGNRRQSGSSVALSGGTCLEGRGRGGAAGGESPRAWFSQPMWCSWLGRHQSCFLVFLVTSESFSENKKKTSELRDFLSELIQ